MSIYDAMQYVQPAVATLCLGMAASGGSLLLTAGAPGQCRALRNSLVLIDQPWTQGMQGKASEQALGYGLIDEIIERR